MAATTASFGELLAPGLHALHGVNYKEFEPIYPKYFTLDTSSRAYEDDVGLVGLGQVPVKAQGSSVSYEEIFQGFKQRYDHTSYGLGFVVSYELWSDDQYRQIKAMPRALAKAGRVTEETVCANVLNRAFNATYTGSDGLELCSTAHLNVSGGTFSNELTTSADLTATSFEQALIDLQNLTDDKGNPINVQPKLLVVPPDLDWTASQLLKSSQMPGTANNDYNPAMGRVPYLVNTYLTDVDAWFLINNVDNGLTFFWRERPIFSQDNDFDSLNAKFKVFFRFSAAWTDPRGVFGSPGV